MKQIIIIFLLLQSIVFASNIYDENTYNIHVKKGWQLLGFPYAINDMSLLDNEHVTLVWKYDNTNKVWEGYSNDIDIKEKIQENNISIIERIDHFNGVWIYSQS